MAAPLSPLIRFDLSAPLPLFDQDWLAKQRQEGLQQDEKELETILADIEQLKREVFAYLIEKLNGLHMQQSDEIRRDAESRADSSFPALSVDTKQTIRTFLERISSAVSTLFTSSTPHIAPYYAPPPMTPPAALQPLMLVDPRAESEKYDLEKAIRETGLGQIGELEELEVILRDVDDIFTSLSIALVRTFDTKSASHSQELDLELSKIEQTEQEQDRERAAMQTFLDNFRRAFEPFRAS
ncbi:hypothetical protein JCM6882_007503 [Rhodosporidiobolus microsporus]